MSALITALDKQSNVQTGENGHSEIGWSKSIDNDSIREKITQFYFQLVRSKEKFDIRNDKIAIVLDELLTSTKIVSSSDTNVELSADYQFKKDMVITLYKILAQTRDIISGKGEYQLAYTQLVVWWKHYPALAKYALHMFVNSADSNDHPYGSWKDIKFFCDYCVKRCGMNEDHTFIEYCSFIMMKQLQKDMKQREESSDNNISLAARWAPRESSKKYGWLARKISEKYFENYIKTAKTDAKMRAAKRKAIMEYRKIIVGLNQELDTIQVKMCGREWGKIDHAKTTSQTLNKSKRSLQNIDKQGKMREHADPRDTEDRALCAKNFSAHLEAAKSGDDRHKIRGKRVGINDFVKDALRVLSEFDSLSQTYSEAYTDSRILSNSEHSEEYQQRLRSIQETRDTINLQWRDNASQNSSLGDMIAMVDTSGSMTCDDSVPMNSAIGLGIRIAEKSKLGRRVMTFSSSPEWINLEGEKEFTDCVHKVRHCNWGMNTDFYKALNMILETIVANKMEAKDVENMVLVVLSDMQIDDSMSNFAASKTTMFENIEKLYEAAGIRVCGKPYKTPHIVFWNLRRTNGFPSSSTDQNVSMVSGFSPVILNQFSEKGVDVLKEMTPWAMLRSSLDHERYSRMENPYGKEFDVVAFSEENLDDHLFHFFP